MEPSLERIEVERPAGTGNHYLPVEHDSVGHPSPQSDDQLWEISPERPLVAAVDPNFGAVAEDERPEAVPLGLEAPLVAFGQRDGGASQHRFDGRHHGQVHRGHNSLERRAVQTSICDSGSPCGFLLHRAG